MYDRYRQQLRDMRSREKEIADLLTEGRRGRSKKRLRHRRPESRPQFKAALKQYCDLAKEFHAARDELYRVTGRRVKKKRPHARLRRKVRDLLPGERYRIQVRSCGGVDVFYGGIGTPGGPCHGHIVINPDGDVLYWRPPFTSRAAAAA